MTNIFVRIIRAVWNNVIGYLREYCNATSIHGFRYLAEKRSCFERVWWLTIFAVCLFFLTFFLDMVYYQWQYSRIIVSPTNEKESLHTIPFPAVTICPETKSYKEMYNHKEMIVKLINREKLTLKELKQISFMSLICENNITEYLKNQFDDNIFSNNTFNDLLYSDGELYDFLYHIFPGVTYFFNECKFFNKELNCTEAFDLVLTDEGLCFSFNMIEQEILYKNDLYLANNLINSSLPNPKYYNNPFWFYILDDFMDLYPRRAMYSGYPNALTITLKNTGANLDPLCKLSHHGFRITVHSSPEIPSPKHQFFWVSLNETVLAEVIPVMTYALFEYPSPLKWGCYSDITKTLGYFDVYNEQNCLMECLYNFTKVWCDCTNFFMPRKNVTDQVCGLFNNDCVKEAEEIFSKGKDVFNDMENKRKNITDDLRDELFDCECLPLCTYVSYEVQTSSSAWDWTDLYAIVFPQQFEELQESQSSLSKLIVYFKEPNYKALNMVELYGAQAALGDLGGLLSLFTGFSVISLMEVIYFLSVRIICNFRLYGSLASKSDSHIA